MGPMRADAFLEAAEKLPFASLDEIARGRGLLVVAPHPDDESLGCGGLIVQACARGLPVSLVVMSDGVGSHPNSVSYPPEKLRVLRERETLEAARALGLESKYITFLRMPDRHVPGSGPDAEAAATEIAAIAQSCGAGTVLVTWAHDPHCDHAASAAIVRLACDRLPTLRSLEYPVWGWALPPETETGIPRGYRLDITEEVSAKRAAVAAHRSQTTNMIDDDPGAFRLQPEMIARFSRPFEIYLEMGQ